MRLPIFILLLLTSLRGVAQHRVILDRKDDYSILLKEAGNFMKPGDTIQLTGRYRSIRIYNIFGTAEKPIVFINKGLVTIEGNQAYTAVFSGKYFKILGNGDAQYPYGIRFISGQGSKYSNFGLQLENSSDIEVAFCEISQVANGIQQNVLIGSAMKDCYFHDNYLHDIGVGEAMKKGTGFYLGSMQTLPPDSKTLFENCRIEHNRLENISAIPIQAYNGSFIIANNQIKKYGTAKIENNRAAIVLGTHATGKITGNIADSSDGNALIILGYGPIDISRNSFTHLFFDAPGKDLVFINGITDATENLPPLKLNFSNNTIEGAATGNAVANITKPAFNAGAVFINNKISGSFKKHYAVAAKDAVR